MSDWTQEPDRTVRIGFPTCPTCEGSGHDLRVGPPHAAQGVNPPNRGTECTYCKCPDCVQGVGITDELVEAVTRDWWDEADALDEYEALDADGKANAHADIEIVLAAVVTHLKEKER